jgi:hypothetical protein
MTDAWPLVVLAAMIVGGFLTMVGLMFFLGFRTMRKVSEHGSIAGALYEGRVGRVIGELEGAPRGIAKVTVKVVSVEREVPAVGIEVHVNARLGYHMRAVRLTAAEALRVADALEAAARR